jgi:hypothetical protein
VSRELRDHKIAILAADGVERIELEQFARAREPAHA